MPWGETNRKMSVGTDPCRRVRSLGQIGPTLARPSVYPETPTEESSSSPSIAHGITTEGLLQVRKINRTHITLPTYVV